MGFIVCDWASECVLYRASPPPKAKPLYSWIQVSKLLWDGLHTGKVTLIYG